MKGLDESLHSQTCHLLRGRFLLFLLQLQAAPSYMYEKKKKIKLRMLLLCITLVCKLHGTFLCNVCIVNCTIVCF